MSFTEERVSYSLSFQQTQDERAKVMVRLQMNKIKIASVSNSF